VSTKETNQSTFYGASWRMLDSLRPELSPNAFSVWLYLAASFWQTHRDELHLSQEVLRRQACSQWKTTKPIRVTLKELEAAGLIETKSLGHDGTAVKLGDRGALLGVWNEEQFLRLPYKLVEEVQPRLTSAEWCAYVLILQRCAGLDKPRKIAYKQLTDAIGRSESQVSRVVKRIEEQGLVTRQRQDNFHHSYDFQLGPISNKYYTPTKLRVRKNAA
jgi:DNA-binding transcriptional ArsR family regulator